jgi:hypothetical protein
MSLARIGAKRIADYDDTSEPNPETIYCRIFYEKTRDALLRSHLWRFAKARATLVNAGTPAFEWDYKYPLPVDFLRLISVYDGSDTVDGKPLDSYELEGNMLLIDSSSCNLRYIKKVVNPDDWDALFLEVYVLSLARKLVMPLAQDLDLKADVDKEITILMPKVRAMDRSEGTKIGRNALKLWVDARHTNIP